MRGEGNAGTAASQVSDLDNEAPLFRQRTAEVSIALQSQPATSEEGGRVETIGA
jgi:hypothetical protein